MEKYKTIILIEKIKKCLEAGKCEEALLIAESIDKKKLKSLSDLSIVAECYFQNRKYEEAKELFLRMYEKNRSRRIVAQLVHLSIKLQDVEEANYYLSEFIKIAPEDFYRYIFQYSIDKMTKAPIVKLIEDLEELKKTEYIESWAYELAKLYHKASLKDKCVAECNDIVLWFGDGDYVERAKALRAYYLGELDVSAYKAPDAFVAQPLETAVNEEVPDSEAVQIEESNDSNASVVEEVSDSEVVQEEESNDSNASMVEEVSDSEATYQEGIGDNQVAEDEEIVDSEVAKEEQMEDSNTTEVDSNTSEKEQAVNSETVQNEEFINCEVATTTEQRDELDTSSYDSIMDENEISEGLARELDVIFSQSTDYIQDSNKQEDQEEFTEQVELSKEEIYSNESGNSKYSDAEQEVEEELYRLLREEGIENNLDAKTVNNSDSKTICNSNVKQVNDNDEMQTEPTGKKQLQKIHLKALSNDQIIQEEELLYYFERHDIGLSDLFGNFIRMEQVQKQLVRSLDQALTQKNNINLIITGERKSGKTRLARCIAKTLNRMNLIQSKKVALIDGVKLNSVDLTSIEEQLLECVLIVERAGMMSKDTVKLLQKLIQDLPNHIIIVLEDTRENMNRLLRTNSSLNSVFNNRVHLHKYSLEDYMGFVYDYLTEREYEIEMEAFIALQNEFSSLLKKERENALPAIFSLLDTIIQKSERRSAALLKEMSQSGRFEESDFMVLRREDIL